MFNGVYLTILLSILTCDASVVADDHKEIVTPQSSQLGDGKVRVDTTQVSFQRESSDVHNENITKRSQHSEPTRFVPSTDNTDQEMYVPSDFVEKGFRSNKKLNHGYAKEPFQEHIAGMKERLVRLRWRRSAENITSSQLDRLAVTMKRAEMENNELKVTVKKLEEKLTTRLLEVETKSSMMMEATAAQQQQQMTTGQLQLQISQMSTKMMKLQDENEALLADLQNISELTSAKITKLQDDNEALRGQLRNISGVTSAKITKLQDDNEALRGQLRNISGVTSAKITKLQDDNEALRGQLRNISGVTSAKITKLQDDNEALRGQLRNISGVTSAKITKLQDDNEALRGQLRNISGVTSGLQSENGSIYTQLLTISDGISGLQAENRSIYDQMRTLTTDNMAQLAEAKVLHTTLLDKVGALQVQASLLDSKLRAYDDELIAVNRSLRTQNTALEGRLNLEIPQLRNDLQTTIMNRTSAEAIGFHASLTSTTTTTRVTGGLVLDRVTYNAGGGYDRNTGAFTVPVTGLYLFLATVPASTGTSWVHVYLDSTELCKTHSRYSTTLELATCHAAVRAVRGQKLWLKPYSHSQIHGDHYTTFTGVLIQREY